MHFPGSAQLSVITGKDAPSLRKLQLLCMTFPKLLVSDMKQYSLLTSFRNIHSFVAKEPSVNHYKFTFFQAKTALAFKRHAKDLNNEEFSPRAKPKFDIIYTS